MALDKRSLDYALFEILAEYKRNGIGKADLIKAMLSFGAGFLAREIIARKKRAKKDGAKCIDAAQSIDLVHSEGSFEFPIFSQI